MFFDFWMSCGGHQTFAMVVKSITNLLKPTCHNGNFGVHNKTSASMAN